MRFKRRVMRLELQNKSVVGLDNLHESSFRRFASFAERTENFENFDALTVDQLDELDSMFFLLNPTAKTANINLDDLTEYQLKAYLAELEKIRQSGKRFDWLGEIKIEKKRRNFAAA